MFNTIVMSCIFFSLLSCCKLISQLFDRRNELAKKAQAEAEAEAEKTRIEAEKLSMLLNLTKSEVSIIKYLLAQPTLSAWLPNETATILLTHKGYIEIVCNKRKKFDIFDNMNLYKNENDTLYTLSQQTRDLINTHKEEINSKWRKIKRNRTLDNYQ